VFFSFFCVCVCARVLVGDQVIESVFQQDRGKGQATAMVALTELRKISNLLREM
jgi:hypothetical protein